MTKPHTPKTPIDRRRTKYRRVDVTCTACGAAGTVPTNTQKRWVGNQWLCYDCQMKRNNRDFTSGGNWIVPRSKS